MRPACALVLLVFGLCVGCGARRDDKDGFAPADAQPQQPAKNAGDDVPAAKEGPAVKEARRKIVYVATIRLIVEDFGKARLELLDLLRAHSAFVATSEAIEAPGAPRGGMWKLRVPVERFDAFHAALVKLGELQRTNVDSQDVTDEFVDVEARIRNFEKEEAGLLEVLQKSAGKLDDVLAVRREVTRVRGEIERLQGRKQLLKNLSDLATVSVFINERSSYVPEESPSFPTRIGRAFDASLTALTDLGKGIVIASAALAPWILPLSVIGGIALLVLRRWRGRVVVAGTTAATAPPQSPG